MWKESLVKKATEWLIGGELFDGIKNIVSDLMSSDIPGGKKRDAALTEIKTLGYDTADFLINLGIEVALMYLRAISSRA